MRSPLARSVQQHRAFLELAGVIGAEEHGLWTGALPVLLAPLGAAWGAAYRTTGNALELSACQALPVALRAHIETFDLTHDAAFAGCRAVRTRRPVNDERLFAGVVDTRTASQLDAENVSAGTAVPIVHGGKVLGVIVVGALSRDVLDPDSLTFLTAAASFLAPALALAEPLQRRAVTDDRRPAPLSSRSAGLTPSSHGPSSTPPAPGPSSAPPPARPMDVARIALDAVKQVGTLLRGTGTDMRMAVEEDCFAAGESNDLFVAITHLVTNAVEAASERAPIAGAPSHPRRVRLKVAREGAAVAIGIEDSGRGVPPDLRARVFDPGFTTKGKGRGRGLHMVRQTALELGGHVEIGSSELGGALFRLVLPATAARPQGGDSGTWRNGATWPQLRTTGHEGGSLRRGGPPGDRDEPPLSLRAVVSW